MNSLIDLDVITVKGLTCSLRRVRNDDVSIFADLRLIAGGWLEVAAVCSVVAVLVIVGHGEGREQCPCLFGIPE